MTMILVDMRDHKTLTKELEFYRKQAMPFAARTYVNGAAFKTRELWRREITTGFVLRNRYILNSVRVERAQGINIASMEAVVGTVADELETQELGDTLSGTGKHGKAIPTSFAAGQGMNKQPRTRLVRGPHKLDAIKLTKRGTIRGNRKQQNAARIRMAKKAGDKFIFLDLGDNMGLFKLTGTGKRAKIKMVWSLSHDSVTIKRNPMLQMSLLQIDPRLPGMYVDAVVEQLKRARVFGY